MNTNRKFDVYAAGMAIFAMFFGAGNIIFPLALGQHALDKTPYALLGLILTAVIMPFTGLLAMFLYKGNTSLFFGRIGKIPGFILACMTIALLGPLGCAPRCIALAYSTVSMSIPGIPLTVFSAISCVLIFLCVFNRGNFLALLGYFLSPIKVFLLILIIIVGFYNIPEVPLLTSSMDETSLFFHGLKEGYNTMDLIGAFFFAPVIIASLASKDDPNANQGLSKFILKASCIGGALLAIVYVGFCYLAYIYAVDLQAIPSDRLLGAIAIKVLGPYGGLLVSLTVAVACFTTAIALIAAFATFIQKEVLKDKINYTPIVVGSLIVTFILTTFEFQGIAAFLGPVLEMCYPVLIFLTMYNLACSLLSNRKTPEDTTQGLHANEACTTQMCSVPCHEKAPST